MSANNGFEDEGLLKDFAFSIDVQKCRDIEKNEIEFTLKNIPLIYFIKKSRLGLQK